MKTIWTKILPLMLAANISLSADCENPEFFPNCHEECNDNWNYWNGYYNRFSDVYLGRQGVEFIFGYAPMWLKPFGSNLDYAVEAFPLPVTSPNWEVHGINPDYSFGFDVYTGIYFNCNSTWIVLDWQHFKDTHHSKAKTGSSSVVGPLFAIGSDAVPYTNALGEVKYDFDEFNLDYGVSLNLTERLRTNFFGGLSFARVRQNVVAQFSNEDLTITRQIESPSTFTGIGPQFGFDFAYQVWNCLSLTGRSVGSVLVGRQENNTKFYSNSPELASLGITAPNAQETHVNHSTGIVPAYTQRLGLAYQYTFCNGFNFVFELGYEAKIYFNAIQTVDIGSEGDPSDDVGVYAGTFHKTLSNFGLAGPYINFCVSY